MNSPLPTVKHKVIMYPVTCHHSMEHNATRELYCPSMALNSVEIWSHKVGSQTAGRYNLKTIYLKFLLRKAKLYICFQTAGPEDQQSQYIGSLFVCLCVCVVPPRLH